jgi:1-acyl-sn-glycerol-3-phosphate acyltransferase
MIRSLLIFITRLVCGTNARWVGVEPSLSQRVYFANHTSHLDFMVLWAALPEPLRLRTRPVAGKTYWEKNPLGRYLATKVFNSILIDRAKDLPESSGGDRMEKARQGLDHILEALGSRYSLILFPEGTRGDGLKMNNFKSGLYYLARNRPQLEFVPVYLENLNRILPKGEFLPVPLIGSATFGSPLKLEPGESKTAFLERARQAIERLRVS